MLGYKLAMYHDGTRWKPCIVLLEIPNDAVIVRQEFVDGAGVKTYSKKLRCDKAKVLNIVDFEDANVQINRAVSIYVLGLIMDGHEWRDGVHHIPVCIWSYHPRDILDYACKMPGSVYMPSRVVKPTGLDTDVTEECGEGIHFFLSEEGAREYYFEGGHAGNGKSWPIAVMTRANIRTIR